ncbi:hypothetical protein WDR87_001136 [Klebsiella quasipneumoniae]
MSVAAQGAKLKIEWLIGADALLFVLLIVVLILRVHSLEHDSLNTFLSYTEDDE